MALRNWNPNEPYALGLEWPGMRSLTFPLSQEVEIGHTFQANASETIDKVCFEISPPSVSATSLHTALATVYKRDSVEPTEIGNEVEYGTVTTTLVPCNGGTLSGASLINAASVTAALATPSDYSYVDFDSGDTATLEFATSGLFTGKRILEVKLTFCANERDLNTTGKPICFLHFRNASSFVMGGLIDVDRDPFQEPFLSTVRTLSLGEVNYNSGALPDCWPWTPAEVQGFDSGALFIRFIGSTYGLNLHYAALEVVWCEENREAVAAKLMGSDTASGMSPMPVGRIQTLLRHPTTGADNWSKTADVEYAVTLTEARSPGFGFVASGPSPYIPAVDGFDIFKWHQGRVAPRLSTNVLGDVGADSRVTPLKFVTTGAAVPTDFAPYDQVLGAPVYTPHYAAQDIEQRSGGGTVQYPWIRFYARIIGDPADIATIIISHSAGAGTMNYTATSLLALPEIFDGWREVVVRWPAGQEPSLSNAGTNFSIKFSSTLGSINNRWEILCLDSIGVLVDSPASGNPTYGQGDSQAAYSVNGAAEAGFPYQDLVVTLHTDPPAVTGFDTSIITVPFSYEGDCPTHCRVPSIKIVSVAFTTSGLADSAFGYYEIQRKDTYDTTFKTIAKLTSRLAPGLIDLEMRRGGVTSDYRMRIVRADGIEGPWTATSSETLTTDATTPCGTFYLTSNTGNVALAYGEVFDGSVSEGFTFVEADEVVLQRMFGKFGTQSFHPTERRGVAFERTLLLNQIAVTPDALLQNSWDALRDLAWADIPYVCISDEIGNRWFGTLIVPDGTYFRSKGVHIASIRFIESTQDPFPDSA